MSTQLERYLTGLPLSEENAALLEGREPAAELAYEQRDEEGLSADERAWLRRLFHEPGFAIFLSLLKSCAQVRENSAKLLSTTDPLGNRDEVANSWAYVACYNTILAEIQLIVKRIVES